MTWLWISLGVLAALIVLIAIVGAVLPVGHAAARRIALPLPAKTVFDTITGVDAFPQWRGLRKVGWLPDRSGKKVFRETGPHGPMDLAIERSEPNRLFVTRIVTERSPFGGTWTFRLDERDGATSIAITENGEVYNVIFRCLARFVFGHTSTIEGYLRALAKRCGAPDAQIEPCEPDPAPAR